MIYEQTNKKKTMCNVHNILLDQISFLNFFTKPENISPIFTQCENKNDLVHSRSRHLNEQSVSR